MRYYKISCIHTNEGGLYLPCRSNRERTICVENCLAIQFERNKSVKVAITIWRTKNSEAFPQSLNHHFEQIRQDNFKYDAFWAYPQSAMLFTGKARAIKIATHLMTALIEIIDIWLLIGKFNKPLNEELSKLRPSHLCQKRDCTNMRHICCEIMQKIFTDDCFNLITCFVEINKNDVIVETLRTFILIF